MPVHVDKVLSKKNKIIPKVTGTVGHHLNVVSVAIIIRLYLVIAD